MSDSVYNTSLKESSGTNLKIHDSYTEVLKSTDNAKLTLSNGVIVFTDDKKLFIHDGETLGGVEFYNAKTSYELFNPSLRNPDGNIVVGNKPTGDVNKTTIYGESGQVVINSESSPALSVTGNTTLNGKLTVTGATNINAPLVVGDADADEKQKFTVYGDETITGISNLQGHTTIGLIEPNKPANLIVTGISNLYGDTTIGLFEPDKPANFIVTGKTTLTGDVSLPKAKFTNTATTLSAPTQINNTLKVTGTTELKSTEIGKEGATADLTVNGGETTLNSTLEVSGDSTFNSNTTVNADLSSNRLFVYQTDEDKNGDGQTNIQTDGSKIYGGIWGKRTGKDKNASKLQLIISSTDKNQENGGCLYLIPNTSTGIDFSTGGFCLAGRKLVQKVKVGDIKYSVFNNKVTIGKNQYNVVDRAITVDNTSYPLDKDETNVTTLLYTDNKADADYLNLRWDGSFYARYDVTGLSDKRYKDDIKPIENAVDKVQKIGGYTFTRKDEETGKRYTGCIAQEVAEVLPEAVYETDGQYALAYGNMVGLLIEAIKELKAEIEELKKDK